jgi:murein DD-endopeptidase MepM/ murein hydrolase activator NlpD
VGRLLRRAGCALIVALVLAPSASARVGLGYGLGFVWPADGTLSSPFGSRYGGFHPGIDIGSLQSLTVRAASPGRVVGIGSMTGYEGYGNVVIVDIGGGFTTMYAHLSRTLVGAGRQVESGEVIGVAGCTGWCTGTHLHFELRDHGRPMDPLTLFAPLPVLRTPG